MQRPIPLRALFYSALTTLILTPLSARAQAEGPASAAPSDPPKLTVVIAVDQFRADYLERFGPHFSEGGFKRILREGVQFTDCWFPQALTVTGPGHAAILSGVSPNEHGIVGNKFLDSVALAQGEVRTVEGVQDDTEKVIGGAARAAGAEPGGDEEEGMGRSPRRFLGQTLGDVLQAKYGEKSRVVSMANKDRAAMFMAGPKAHNVFWTEGGRFVTSSYYMEQLPDWVERFNARGLVEAYAGKVWEHLLPVEVYNTVQGPDDVAAESTATSPLGRTLPKQMPAQDENGSYRKLYTVFPFTPFSQQHVTALAETAVTSLKLGQGEAPDLLCIGYSQIDIMGHVFGPDSHEKMDSMLRLDLVLAEFLAFLDREVGVGNYQLALTADHGVVPIPEVTAAKDPALGAQRINGKSIDLPVQMALTAALGQPGAEGGWASKLGAGYRLNKALLKERGIPEAKVEALIKDALVRLPMIEAAYTRTELLNTEPRPDTLAGRYRLSYMPDGRMGEVLYTLKPYSLEGNTPTTHGSPHYYDSHVPMLLMGPGIPAGQKFEERVWVSQLAPTLAARLGVELPAAKLGTLPGVLAPAQVATSAP